MTSLEMTLSSDPCVWSWLAGLIDGEGSIMVTHHATRSSSNRIYQRTRPIVSISNTKRILLEAINERTGMDAPIYKHVRPPQRNRRHVSYTWRLRVSEQRVVLPLVLPWVVIKRPQAEWLLQILGIKDLLSLYPNIVERDRLRKERDILQIKIAEANKTGILEVMPIQSLLSAIS